MDYLSKRLNRQSLCSFPVKLNNFLWPRHLISELYLLTYVSQIYITVDEFVYIENLS